MKYTRVKLEFKVKLKELSRHETLLLKWLNLQEYNRIRLRNQLARTMLLAYNNVEIVESIKT